MNEIPPAVTLYWQEERIKELETVLADRTFERDQLRAALKRYGQHAYPCASEHGRFPKRCSCGFDIALML